MSIASDRATAAPVIPIRRLPRFVVTLIALASFGPYLLGSIRTEQTIVYGLLLLLLPLILTRFRPQGGMRFFVPWSLYVVSATVGILVPSATASRWYAEGNLLGGLDNILLPLSVMLLVWSVVEDSEASNLLVRVCKVIAIAMAVNGLIAVIATRVDLSPILRPFWSAEDSGLSVAENAATLGRFSGIFNQPAEAGLMYGVGGIAAIYVWHRRPILLTVLVTFITLGGLISVSKIFVLGGLPVIVIYWFWSQRGGRKIMAVFGVVLAVAGVIQSGLVDQWSGANYLGRLFVGDQADAVAFYSAGRFDAESQFVTVIARALQENPLTGVGAAGWAVAYDGAIAEALVVAGALGLFCYGFVLLALLTLAKPLSGTDRWFTFFLVVVVAGGALGFSPLTGNRVSSVVWLLIALLALMVRERVRGAPHRGTHAGLNKSLSAP